MRLAGIRSARRPRWPRSLAAAALVSAIVLTGCTAQTPTPAEPTPRALTVAESERLAVIRFNNYNSSPLSVSGTVQDGEDTLNVVGYVDYTRHLGYLRVTQPDATASFLALITLNEVGILDDAAVTSDPPPATVPDGDWKFVALDPASSTIASALAVLINLGGDRPENPQLLRQSSARWLRETAIENADVTVMSGPGSEDSTDPGQGSALTYYVTDDGVLRRLEAALGASGTVSIDFGDTTAIEIADPRSSDG